jgi:pimeloyl-ACP methyl ester carboxylesterase
MKLEEKDWVSNNLVVHWYYFKPEEKTGKKIILLHGWGVEGMVFEPIIKFLLSEGMEVFVCDFPGFGKSPVPRKVLNLSDYVKIVKEFIEKEIKEDIIVLGHSFGGRVAIRLASENKELVKTLILVDSAGFKKRGIKISLIKFLAKIFKPLFKSVFFSSFKTKIYKKIGTEDYLLYPELKKTYAKITDEDLTEDLKKIETETMIIWGKDDSVTPLAWGKKMKELIRNSHLYEINGGHFAFLDNEAEFGLILKNILS